ncbi:hypothetical protein BC939DRAFT_499023 [Gamsiella multidivaricata]|uniref:uncharacterized protein n=1 Tax=Gamsiella multidivaricata TaxID=101098 RepID=UPI0022212929|nr:uncharacterized protein BC939DRAFT_499023 [Gamsiella multidivaricata]KAI7831589.1 hypothetical protein BC939DRAFT_499023 [Gamsiella multidivaricata]
MSVFNVFILIACTSIALLSTPVLASCCYTFACQPLPSSFSSHGTIESTSNTNNNNNDNPSRSIALSLTVTSQFAYNSPGSKYLASIHFPSSYVLTAIPSGCISITANSVSCTSSGTSRLVKDFVNIIITDGTGSRTPKLEDVVVNGEQCGLQASCPLPTTITVLTVTTVAITIPSWSSTAMNPTVTATTITTTPVPQSTYLTFFRTPSPTPDSGGNTEAMDRSPDKSNVGLIVGLAILAALLALVVSLYMLRRNRKQKGSLICCGIRRKGSRRPWGRESSIYDVHGLESGSRKSIGGRSTESNEKAAAMQTAEAAARGLVDGRTRGSRSAGPRRNRTPRPPPLSHAGQGMILIDIPEMLEPRRNGANYFGNENDEIQSGFEQEPSDDAGINQQLLQAPLRRSVSKSSRHSWVAAVTNKGARLHRAMSTASFKLHRRSTQLQPGHRNEQGWGQEQGQQRRRPKFPQDGISFRGEHALIRPPKSAHRVHQGGTRERRYKSGVLVTTIRPEHHEQQLRQMRFEHALEYKRRSGGPDDADTAQLLIQQQNYRLPAVGSSVEDLNGKGKATGIRTSGMEVFMNPGPPPLPPPTRPLSHRAQRVRTRPPKMHHLKAGVDSSGAGVEDEGLYGYM